MFQKALDLYFVIVYSFSGKVPRKFFKFVDQICSEIFISAPNWLVEIVGYLRDEEKANSHFLVCPPGSTPPEVYSTIDRGIGAGHA